MIISAINRDKKIIGQFTRGSILIETHIHNVISIYLKSLEATEFFLKENMFELRIFVSWRFTLTLLQ